ncbi:MAG: 50S ribosomal protein L25/general stress protein Ctc [Gemmatimonadetes bacterium]|nr:50S ribosomal protein L25/general stress protein Ctc [Gemmatimonadota bacterium]
MAATANLNAVLRQGRGKGPARRLRRAGRVPAVIYGHGDETRALSVDARELEHLFGRISIESTIIDLTIEGDGAGTVKALVREVQMHPYKPEVVHVDFYQIHAGERIHVAIPIRLVGTAAGVKAGGLMQLALHDVAIRCLPEQIPDAIEHDVSALEIGDSVHVRELAVPPGVEIEEDPDRTVCSVIPPQVIALEAPPVAAEGVGGEVEPELIRRRPEEEEQPPATAQGGAEGSESKKGQR